jgi:hypothetical protein
MATQVGGGPVGGTIGESPIEIERDMNMAEAGVTSGMAGDGKLSTSAKVTAILSLLLRFTLSANMTAYRRKCLVKVCFLCVYIYTRTLDLYLIN